MSIPLDDEHVDLFLRTHRIGRLGLHADGETYVVPVTYVFDQDAIYFHTNAGMKADFLRANPDVCFEVDDVTNPERWQSVIAWGRAEALAGQKEAAAMDLMLQRLGSDGPEAFASSIKLLPVAGHTFKVLVTKKSGRYYGDAGTRS